MLIFSLSRLIIRNDRVQDCIIMQALNIKVASRLGYLSGINYVYVIFLKMVHGNRLTLIILYLQGLGVSR